MKSSKKARERCLSVVSCPIVAMFLLFCGIPHPGISLETVELTGTGTVPAAPVRLKAGDHFACGEKGIGLLTYPDGTYLKILPSCEGQLTNDGLRLKKGEAWVAYRKKNGRFIISTPYSTIGIRGTDFGLFVGTETFRLVLIAGIVEVFPSKGDGKTMLVNPGQLLEFASGNWEVRKASQDDLGRGEKILTGSIPVGGESPSMPRFSDQFLYGFTVIDGGTAEVTGPDGRGNLVAGPGTVVKTGSTIRTSDEFPAKIKLLCGSVIKLAPGSVIRLGAHSILVEKGALLVKHVRKGLPLKIEGKGTIKIDGESVVAFECSGDTLLARVEVGSVFIPGASRRVSEGECVETSASGTRDLTGGIVPRSWEIGGSEGSTALPGEPFDSGPDPKGVSHPGTAPASGTLRDFQGVLGF